MVVVAPPKPPKHHKDLEALIEEARQRARKRRLVVAGAVAAELVLAGGIVAAILLTRGGGSTQAVPRGFHLVQARGSVAHARMHEVGRVFPILVDERTGATRRPGLVMDIWWDRKSGLVRTLGRIDGRVQFDSVGNTCLQGSHDCFAPEAIDAASSGLSWPLNPKFERITGRGRIHGHEVLWVTALPVTSGGSERVALDAKTHQLVARVQWGRTRPFGVIYYSRFPDLPARSFSFVVPNGGAIRHTFPPIGTTDTRTRRSRVGALRGALGATPLWLGPIFRGKRLRSVEVGTTAMRAEDGRLLRPAKFIRLNYGDVKLDEFGGARPYYYVQGPRPGMLAIDGSGLVLTRGRVLLMGTSASPFSAASAIAFSRALRPLGSA